MTKKLILRLLALVLIVSTLSAPTVVFAADSGDTIVQPCYTNIDSIAAALTINTYGKATCTGSAALTYASDSGKIIMYLQKKDGNTWYNLYSWTDSAEPLFLSGSRYVVSGYNYRVKTVLTVYDSAGNYVDGGSAYSPIKYY